MDFTRQREREEKLRIHNTASKQILSQRTDLPNVSPLELIDSLDDVDAEVAEREPSLV